MNKKNIEIVDLIEVNDNEYFQRTFSINNLLSDFDNHKRISLFVGQVQSGKTNYMIEIANNAREKFNFDYIFVLSGSTNKLHSQTYKRFQNKNGFVYDENWINDKQCIFRKGIIVLIKSDKSLGNLYRFIKHDLDKKYKVLIIDDESDYGSVNTKTIDNYSKFSKNITNSYQEIKKGGMILVTATPYSNILNTKNINQIYTIWSAPINENYTGLDYFSNKENFYIVKNFNSDLDYIKYSIYLWIIKSYLIDNDIDVLDKNSDLLIYLSDSVEEHQKIKNDVNSAFRNFSFYFDENLFNQILFEQNINLDQDFFNEWFKNIFLKKFNPNKNIIITNGTNKNDSFDDDKYHIIIGGVMLSRGVTYENLTTELFLYISEIPTVDTLLQRCRWFGYRKNKSNYMNVVTNEFVYDCIKEANKYNDIFKLNANKELNFADVQNKIKEIEKECKRLRGTSDAKR